MPPRICALSWRSLGDFRGAQILTLCLDPPGIAGHVLIWSWRGGHLGHELVLQHNSTEAVWPVAGGRSADVVLSRTAREDIGSHFDETPISLDLREQLVSKSSPKPNLTTWQFA